MPATVMMPQSRLVSWTTLDWAYPFIGRSHFNSGQQEAAKRWRQLGLALKSSERSCDLCDGVNGARPWHWPQRESCRFGSAMHCSLPAWESSNFSKPVLCTKVPFELPQARGFRLVCPAAPRKVDPKFLRIAPEPHRSWSDDSVPDPCR